MGHINSRCENKWWTYLKAAKTTWVSTPKEFERLTLRPSLLTSYIRCSHLLFRSLICQCKCSANIADGIWTLARIPPVITHREKDLVVTLKAWLTRSKSAKILQLLLSKSSRTHKWSPAGVVENLSLANCIAEPAGTFSRLWMPDMCHDIQQRLGFHREGASQHSPSSSRCPILCIQISNFLIAQRRRPDAEWVWSQKCSQEAQKSDFNAYARKKRYQSLSLARSQPLAAFHDSS